jgi:hypothetical protein
VEKRNWKDITFSTRTRGEMVFKGLCVMLDLRTASDVEQILALIQLIYDLGLDKVHGRLDHRHWTNFDTKLHSRSWTSYKRATDRLYYYQSCMDIMVIIGVNSSRVITTIRASSSLDQDQDNEGVWLSADACKKYQESGCTY